MKYFRDIKTGELMSEKDVRKKYWLTAFPKRVAMWNQDLLDKFNLKKVDEEES